MTTSTSVVVHSAVAPMLGEPRISTSLTSQLLAGDVLQLLDAQGPWLRVRSADAYEGWTHSGYLRASSGTEATWPWSLGCTVRCADGTVRALPLGARIAPDETLLSGDSIAATERATRFPGTADAIATSAARLFVGASYLWGGVSPWGCDCSGFVQRVFALHGLQVPRDAWQQAELGTVIDRSVSDDHHPADVLFFSDRDDRRITHVGIALGGDQFVHSALMRGGVARESLRAGDEYVARLRAQCVGVRRLL